jgi:DNA primase
MCQARFSSEELRAIRNQIDVKFVIVELLGIPSKAVEGRFRFLCPLCGEFRTATNPKTNLGRCFRCKSNFNTIELVMSEKQLSFIESVKLLQPHIWRHQAAAVKARAAISASNIS